MLRLDIGILSGPYWIVDKDLICFLVSLLVFRFPLHLPGKPGAFADLPTLSHLSEWNEVKNFTSLEF